MSISGRNFGRRLRKGSGANCEGEAVKALHRDLITRNRQAEGMDELFAGRHFDRDVINSVRALVFALQAQPAFSSK